MILFPISDSYRLSRWIIAAYDTPCFPSNENTYNEAATQTALMAIFNPVLRYEDVDVRD